MKFCGRFALCAVTALLGIQAAAGAEAMEARIALFDTGTSSSAPLAEEALSKREGWRRIPEGERTHSFKGDAVLANERLAVVLRRDARGAEAYSKAPNGWKRRALLAPLARNQAAKVSSVRIIENNPNAVSVDVVFSGANGKRLILGYELKVGLPIVKTAPRAGVSGLRVGAPCRLGVLPDFFADDILLDATKLPVARAEVPSEHFFLHMAGKGEAIIMATWDTRDREIEVTLSGRGKERLITGSEIAYGRRGKIWVAVLEGAGIWHMRELTKKDARKVVALDWRMPYPAAWRAGFTTPEELTNSWELIAQRPDGKYGFMKRRMDFFGKAEKTFPPNRRGWSTALGSFHHPCWVDRAGKGFVQFATHHHFQYAGPVVIYPLDRGKRTPLDAYTVVDVMRNSLGVGPCEYILDLEGQKVANKGLFTCGARGRLNGIYQRKQQKQKKAEIEKVLTDVLIFVKAIRARVDRYVSFGHDMLDFLAEQKKAHPRLAKFINEMEQLTRVIDARFARRKSVIRTPKYAAGLTDEFRRTLIDYEGADALKKCKKITSAIVRVGDSQDHLVAECRMAIKILRQRAGLAMAANPAVETVAREIRRRAHKALRGQLGHEGALYR